MTKKRRNNGHKHRNCGKVPVLRCDGCNSVVPKDKARIRVQLSAAHTKEHLNKAIDAFIKVGKKLNVI